MLKLGRVCVPLSLDCDLSCKYCYRVAGHRDIPEFNDLMKTYLGQLSPEWCNAVVASGGEPLLHEDKVYELFSYTPKNIHKKVMTNGLNLTQEFVDYVNREDIEVHISHDGEKSKYLRGIDILLEPDILALVRQINDLKVFSVCTALNSDPLANYEYTQKLLGRTDFVYATQPVFVDEFFPELINNFDWDAYSRGYIELAMRGLFVKQGSTKGYVAKQRSEGFNVLPDASVVGMTRIDHTYGTILDTKETLVKNKIAMGDGDVCNNAKCRVRDRCKCMSQIASPHTCKGIAVTADVFAFLENINNEDD